MCYNLTTSRELIYGRLCSNRAQIQSAFLLVFLMLSSIYANLFSNLEYDNNNSEVNLQVQKNFLDNKLQNEVVFLPNLDYYHDMGEELVELVVITNDLNSLSIWQEKYGYLVEQEYLKNG